MARSTPVAPRSPHSVQRFPERQRPPIDTDRLTAAIDVIRHYRLGQDPEIAMLLRALSTPASNVMLQVTAERLISRAETFALFHATAGGPFRVVPPGAMDGEIKIGRQHADGALLGIPHLSFARHVGISGPSGSGKTTILLMLIAQLHPQANLLVLEGKNDFDFLLRDSRVLIIDEATPWNILIPPAWLPVEEYDDELINTIVACWYGAILQRDIDTTSLRAARACAAYPSLRHWRDKILEGRKGEGFSRREARLMAAARLERLQHWKLFDTTDTSLTWDDLASHTIVLRVREVDEVTGALFTFLVRMIFLRNRISGIRDQLTHVMPVDEGYKFLAAQYDGITSVHPFMHLAQQVREFSMGIIWTSTSVRAIHPLIRSSTAHQFALRATNHQEARQIITTFGMTKEEAEYYLRAPQGEAFFKGDYPTTVHLDVPRWPYNKNITTSDLHAAQERTNARAIKYPPIEMCSQPEEQEQSPQQGAVKQSIFSDQDEAILAFICTEGVTTPTEIIQHFDLHPMTEQRSRKRFRATGVIGETRAKTGRGRGKTSLLTYATDAAYNYSKIAKPPSGRGAGPIHQWYRNQIRKIAPNALGEGGGADLAIIYDPAIHERLLQRLNACGASITPKPGDAIGIEIELHCHDTLETNLQRDVKRFQHIVVVVPTTQLIAASTMSNGRASVIDLYALIDTLSEES